MGISDYPPTLPPQKAALQRCVIRPGVADKQVPAEPGTLAPRPCGSVGPNGGRRDLQHRSPYLIRACQTNDIARHPVFALMYNRRGIFNRSADLLLKLEAEILPFQLPGRGLE